jgi:diguanylate cyclase (GGDEF)-like protein/PAS domain S-box-containing protein
VAEDNESNPGMTTHRANLLLVDDIPSNIQILAAALDQDYDIRFATSGLQALELVAQAIPDLILLDVMMPGLDGLEVCRRLKANPDSREIPVIFVTAKGDSIDQKAGFELGAVDYIVKPFDIEVVRVRVRTQLRLKHVEAELRASETRLRAIFEHAPEPMLILSEGTLTDCNLATARVLGYPDRSALLGRTPADLSPELQPDGEASASKAARLIGLAAGGASQHFEWVHLRIDGNELIAAVSLEPVSLNGKPVVLCTWHDITQRKRAEDKLKLAASVFSNAREGIMITDASGNIVDVNETFTRITGYTREEALGQNPRMLKSGLQAPEYYVAMWQALSDKGHWYGELWNRRKSGEIFAQMLNVSAVRDDNGQTLHYVALFTDITALKNHQQQLEHIAHFDALTNLPNRVLLADRLQQAMAQSQRRGKQLAVAYLDLDGFKAVNDEYGHDIGDQLLITIAHRMNAALRDGDTLARIGGDEFVAVLADLDRPENIELVLSRLLLAAADPVTAGQAVLRISASIGVTIYPHDGSNPDQLIRHADQAMYVAKQAGKNRYHLFDVEKDIAVKTQRETLEHIRLAIDRNEFVLHYQPKVNMKTGTVIGAEALIRWQHPERGLLPPAAFLPIIEDHHLGVEIGQWVLDSALSQLDAWRSLGLNIPVSINIAARHLQQSNFVAHLQHRLAAHPEIDPSLLELEVLETSALEDMARVSEIMRACREIGVRFALDDFGTGYSSLTYLKRLPADVLKIDQSFIHDMLDDPDDLAIVEGVLGLAQAFRRQVIAEGVESIAHGELLLPLGCDHAQGFGIARPMPADDFPDWVLSWRPDRAWTCWRDRGINRNTLPLLFAEVEHRAWIKSIERCLKGEREIPPPLDAHQCRFGAWHDHDGLAHFGNLPGFQQIAPIHQRIHILAAELLNLYQRGRQSEALLGCDELHALTDALVAILRELSRPDSSIAEDSE